MSDKLQKFLFENASVRGELVEISETWQQVQARHDYPKAVKALLGEMLSAAALLSANLKFNGDNATLRQLVHEHGNGRFVITLDPHEKLPGQQPYQGVVPLDGDNIATVIENYMLRSEQLDTKIWLAANDQVSRGLLLQKLPGEGGVEGLGRDDGHELETWNHVVVLASTLKNEEMLETDIDTLMRRLFWEEDIRVFDPQQPQFRCTCSRDKVAGMLQMLGKAEIDHALTEQGKLTIHCDFCGQAYGFDAVDCAQLFAVDFPTERSLPASDQLH
ncbi:MAG: hslo [Burkholderiaceae bacterium]|nr:hslo [Burkholderiaceae bacterium]